MKKEIINLKHLIKENPEYLRIKVLPKSNQNKVVDIMSDGTIKIRIKAVPEKGKANKELIKFLSKELNKLQEKITIISGKTDQIKLIKIT